MDTSACWSFRFVIAAGTRRQGWRQETCAYSGVAREGEREEGERGRMEGEGLREERDGEV